MPSTGKLAKVLFLITLIISIAFGGFRILLPWIFGLDTDFMFVLLPTAAIAMVLAIYWLSLRLYNETKEIF